MRSDTNSFLQLLQDEQTVEQLNVTLVELNKAIENMQVIYQTAHSLGLFDLLSSKKNVGSLVETFKSIDFSQIMALINSPLVQSIVNDPEFLELLAPDTGTTPGTSLADLQNNPEPNHSQKAPQ
ncbi:hypothetical protein [Caldalkalibacillus mannanilyticus]|uniref:hypothetical protein n=1 Tax=Caldalkalibacillus mannanilyticus TaxID=1418 RepID=UPI00046B030B|nr:hypothetical protein [Caldalkalibacillus mannanilyticus]